MTISLARHGSHNDFATLCRWKFALFLLVVPFAYAALTIAYATTAAHLYSGPWPGTSDYLQDVGFVWFMIGSLLLVGTVVGTLVLLRSRDTGIKGTVGLAIYCLILLMSLISDSAVALFAMTLYLLLLALIPTSYFSEPQS